ncbi:MAG: phosphoglucosamine mutase [Pseudomonadota bacterium]
MTQKCYFGTDGVRGRVGDYPITPDFVLKLGWAIGKVFANEQRHKVLIGKDTRISGYMFESALQAGLSAAGCHIRLLGPMPTPAIAYLTRTFRACAGIVISASHNQYEDNGIKIFSSEGTKLPDNFEQKIEKYLAQEMQVVASDRLGKAKRIDDAPGRYIEFCKSTIPLQASLHGLKIVLDCANGATYYVAPRVFLELGAKIVRLGIDPNGLNINANCGSTHPELLRETVLAQQADVGIALDGDGDRLIMVDHKGEIVDGDELLYIIAKTKLATNKVSTGIVGTQMSNYGLELAFKDLGVEFIRTKVGDRYIMEELSKRNWLYGGESSGHILCLDMTTTGDGIVSALQVLGAMMYYQRSLHELKQSMQKFPQILINVPVKDKTAVMHDQSILDAVSSAEAHLKGRGRILFRPSGTEPLVRIMVEGDNENLVNEIACTLAEHVKALNL